MDRATDPLPVRRVTRDDPLQQFDSGVAALDDWLAGRALKADRSGTAAVYVLPALEADLVAGYYCLSAYSVARATASGWFARNAPDPIPALLLGRLAVDRRFQGRGLGAALLRDAARRAAGAAGVIGARALVVDAIDAGAAAFYRRHLFQPFPQNPLKLYHRL